MTKVIQNKKLATVALAGMLAMGSFSAVPAFAGGHGANGCSAAGCKSKTESEGHKSGCNANGCKSAEKSSCKAAEGGDKASCKGASSCAAKEGEAAVTPEGEVPVETGVAPEAGAAKVDANSDFNE